jgi:hypothetical protein
MAEDKPYSKVCVFTCSCDRSFYLRFTEAPDDALHVEVWHHEIYKPYRSARKVDIFTAEAFIRVMLRKTHCEAISWFTQYRSNSEESK